MADTKSITHLCLVDGSGFIFRAFYSMPPLTRSDGTPVNAVLGFCNMLYRLAQELECDGFAVLFDRPEPTFRHVIYPNYKANRDKPPEELVPQFSIIHEATTAFGFPAIDKAGYEADDLIATYARQARERGWRVTIVSSDKDLMQLVGDGIDMIDPKTMARIEAAQVVEKFGVAPEKVIDVQALAGDPTDNVPGVRGIGIKIAAELINIYGDLDTLLERSSEIKQPKRRQALQDQADSARLSRELVSLKTDVSVSTELDSFALSPPVLDVLRPFLIRQDFKALLKRMERELGGQSDGGDLPKVESENETSYELVQTVDGLSKWVEAAMRAGIVAVDTETTSLDSMSADLVGVSLAINPGAACYIPVGHGEVSLLDRDGSEGTSVTKDKRKQIPIKKALALLKPLLEDRGVLKIGQNIKYDMSVLAREPYNINISPIDDTMLMSFVLDAGRGNHGMDVLAQQHLGIHPIPYKEVVGTGKKQISFDQVPLTTACEYAAEDADVTLRLFNVLNSRLVSERMVSVYQTLERPLAVVLSKMESAGIKVDQNVLASLSEDFAERIEVLSAEIYQLAGREFTIGSPKQLGAILFDELGLSGGKKTKTGAYATGAEVLEELHMHGHELPGKVLDWRQLSKLKSTYTDALIGQINPMTGRVHTSYSMVGAATGRLSSTDPNLQNIPIRTEEGRKIRRAFIAEPKHTLLSADYSQIELRLLAHIADISVLADAFRNGADIHSITASQVFNVEASDVDPLLRRRAKAINFGIIYGQSPFGLANLLKIPQREAKQYIEAYFARYPGIVAYMDQTKEFAHSKGYVETIFGRRCHVPAIGEKNPARRNYAERQAINAPIQGSAADIIKRAMIEMPSALLEAGLNAKMLLQVHDELLFEVPESEVEETKKVVSETMECAALPARELQVPITVDIGYGENWSETH